MEKELETAKTAADDDSRIKELEERENTYKNAAIELKEKSKEKIAK